MVVIMIITKDNKLIEDLFIVFAPLNTSYVVTYLFDLYFAPTAHTSLRRCTLILAVVGSNLVKSYLNHVVLTKI